MLFLLAAIAATAPWATYLQFAPFLTVVTSLIGLLFLVILGLLASGHPIEINRLTFSIILYLTLVVASGSWAISMLGWSNYIFWWFLCSVAFYAASQFLTDEKSLRTLSIGSMVGVVLTAILIRQRESGDFFEDGRYAIPDHNSNFTAYVLAGMVYVFFLVLLVAKPNRILRLGLYGATALALVLTFMLGTRGGQISIILIVLFSIMSRFSTHGTRKAMGIMLFTVAVAFTFGLLQPILTWLDSMSNRSTGDLSGRLTIWTEALGYIRNNLLLGIGPGSFVDVSSLGIGAHNLFLTILLDTGLIGFTVFCGIFIAFYRSILTGTGRQGSTILMLFLCYWVPIVTSGHWDLSPYSWITVGASVSAARIIRRRTIAEAALTVPPRVTATNHPLAT